ncbi:hypothetical protein MUK42_08308 [Musa troglodytarum]|uniref:Erythronate-4-phosphate dehydrogenase family protein n=1 Tax=Musa troglodytarum TaxID=320322 RepID=A0A9E7J8E8_9LILI|nr:hypothetical protein MUK42_08308 [Musa troglodytarum]
MMVDPPPPADERSGTPAVATALSIPRRIRVPPFRLLPSGPATTPSSPSSWLEIRLFYVRISPCAVDAVPAHLTLSHLRREMGDALEINGARVPASDTTAIPLRRDRLDRGAAEVTYVSTDSVRIAGAVDFEVCDDRGNLILCGSLQRLEAPWSNGVIAVDNHHGSSDKDRKTGWGMDCFPAASAGASSFVQPKLGIVSPSIEVYVAGCFAAAPLILTQTLQVSPRRKAVKPGTLGSIPEDEETTEHEKKVNNDTLVQRRASSSLAAEEEAGGYDSEFSVAHCYHPEGWSPEEDGQLSWFNAGVRVGVGIGLGMCVGIGIGVGLLMRSYQATTRSFKRRFF